ncbi:subtilisin-like serine protease [Ceratobasidium sp. 395]|nr:subtilisin-like serine protease [Ceratobasidium sp. 395]
MKSFVAIAAILAVPAFAVPAAIPVTKLAGPAKADSYIIKLKDGASKDSHIARLLQEIGASADASDSKVTYEYNSVMPEVYAGSFKGPILDYIRRSPDVEWVQADTIYKVDYFEGDEKLAARAIDLQESDLSRRASNGTGEGVDIYGIDTGILTTHTCFGGRAKWGATFGGYADADGNGHGTRKQLVFSESSKLIQFPVTDTAGTAAGTGFGLATGAYITAVKVCSDAGECASSDIIAGVNYAVEQSANSTKPSIATMSLGGEADPAIDKAVSNAIGKGMHFTVAAGNDNVDAADSSPARVGAANTIGAIDSSNKKASFSNFGSILDVWALGVNVRSAWIGSNSATNTISGTSMATPQVAGILAVVLGRDGQVDPATLSKSLKSHAQPVVTGNPDGTTNLKAVAW